MNLGVSEEQKKFILKAIEKYFSNAEVLFWFSPHR